MKPVYSITVITTRALNCIWHEQFLLLIWKALQCRNANANKQTWRCHNIDYSKMRKYWFNISENISGVIFKLGTIIQSQKGSKMMPVMLLPWQHFCYWPFSKYKLKFPVFFLEQKSSTPKNLLRNLLGNMGSIRTLSLTLWGWKLRYLFKRWKGTGAK